MKNLLTRHRLPAAAICGIVMMFLLVSAGTLQVLAGVISDSESPGGGLYPEREREAIDFSSPLTMLLLGVDSGQRGKEPPNVDTIALFYLDPVGRQAVALSIPRDTIVFMPGLGWGKLSTSYYFGGAELTRATVEHFSGVPVDYYVELNFQSVISIVDALGGITVDVDRLISHEGITIQPGVQQLRGQEALILLRFRNEPMADIARVNRQQRFVKTFLERLRQEENKRNLAALLPAFYRYVKTDLALKEIINFYFSFREADYLEDLRFETVPGEYYLWGSQSSWRADLGSTDSLLHELFGPFTDGVGFKRYSVLEQYERQRDREQAEKQ